METLLHVSTRWLSLEMVVSRILRLYKALKSYFGSIRKYKPSFDFETYLMYPSNVTRYQFFACHKFTQCQGIWKCFKIIIYLFCCASSLTPQMRSKPGVSGCVNRSRTQWRRSISCSTSRHRLLSHISTCYSSGKTLVSIYFMNKYIALIVAFSVLFVVELTNI